VQTRSTKTSTLTSPLTNHCRWIVQIIFLEFVRAQRMFPVAVESQPRCGFAVRRGQGGGGVGSRLKYVRCGGYQFCRILPLMSLAIICSYPW